MSRLTTTLLFSSFILAACGGESNAGGAMGEAFTALTKKLAGVKDAETANAAKDALGPMVDKLVGMKDKVMGAMKDGAAGAEGAAGKAAEAAKGALNIGGLKDKLMSEIGRIKNISAAWEPLKGILGKVTGMFGA